jgi:ATP-binding cassette, subfamily C (CFTR/MRP), member 5
MMRVLAYGATWAISYRTAIRTRGAVLALLYKKLLNAKTLRGKSPAQVLFCRYKSNWTHQSHHKKVVNMFANDGQRIFDAVTFAPLVLVGPFVLIGGLIYLLRVIGPLSLLGVAVFFVFDIIQVYSPEIQIPAPNFPITFFIKSNTICPSPYNIKYKYKNI